MRVTITVNGERHEADDVWEGESLLYVLRERMGLPGSKNACEQGECGSCTVYLDGVTCCACLVAAGQADGRARRDGRGARRRDDALHPVQQAFVDAGAVQCGFCTPGLLVATHDLLARDPDPDDAEIREALAGNLCRCTGYEKILDAGRTGGRGAAADDRERRDRRSTAARSSPWTATAPSTRSGTSSSRAPGSRRSAPARAPRDLADATYVDAAGCLATPGLVNTHHHLYQWVTRGFAVDHTLFEWLTTLYPVWACIDEDTVRVGGDRRAGAAGADRLHDDDGPPLRLPARTAATCSAPRSRRPVPSGCASCRPAGRWTSAPARAACRPTTSSRTSTRSSAATAEAIDRHHDPSPDSMLRVGVAPCSPFSVTGDLLEQAAELARDKGVRLHTHLAETIDEDDFCREPFGCSPRRVRRVARLARPRRLAGPRRPPRRRRHRRAGRRRGTGVAHCPSSNARLGRRHLPHPRPARGRGPGRARRRRRRVQRGELAGRGAAPRRAVRPRRRRAASR